MTENRKKSHWICSVFIFVYVLFPIDEVFSQKRIDSLEAALINSSGFEKVKILNSLSKLYTQHSPEKAIIYGKNALELSESLGSKVVQARACINIGAGYEFLSAYDKALHYYIRSLSLYEETNDSSNIAKSLNHIGFIYWYLNDLDKAMDYYRQSLKIAQAIDDRVSIASNLNEMGLIYWARGEFENALNNYFTALKIAEQLGDERKKAAILNNIGIVYEEQKKYDLALDSYFNALEMNKQANRTRSMVENYNNIGNVYIQLQKYSKAFSTLQRARKLAVKVSSDYLLNDNNFYMYNLFLKQGQYRKALSYMEQYSTLKDSLVSAEKRAKINELQTMYAMEEKDNEIRLLMTEKRLKESQLQVRNNVLIFLSVGFIGILFFSVVILNLHMKTNRAYKVLVNKNLKIVEYERNLINFIKKHRLNQLNEDDKMPDQLIQEIKAGNIEEPILAIQQENENSPPRKYSQSALTDAQKEKLKNEILVLMDEKKYFMQRDFNIEKLSDLLGVNRSYVSQVINEIFKKSFNNFINDYRIKEARKLLSEDKDRIYTIESIAQSVGFNSVNAFNRAFKKFTGITPSFFMQSLRDRSS